MYAGTVILARTNVDHDYIKGQNYMYTRSSHRPIREKVGYGFRYNTVKWHSEGGSAMA